MEHRAATEADIDAIIANLSENTRREIENHGKTLEDAKNYCLEMMAKHGGVTGLSDGHPVIIFGLDFSSDMAVFTWILAAEAYYQSGLTGVRFARRFMRGVVAQFPGKSVLSISGSVHPDVERWFKAIGAEFVCSDGVSKVFRHL